MQSVKKTWKARGNRQETSRGAKEKPRVSLAGVLSVSLFKHSTGGSRRLPVANAEPSDTVGHLDNDEFAATAHLASLALPDLRHVNEQRPSL